MNENFKIKVREIELKDIDLIADYWLESEPDFLINMGVDLNKLPTRSGLRKMLNEIKVIHLKINKTKRVFEDK